MGLDCVCRIFNHISFTVSVTHVFLGLPTLLFGGSIGFKEPLCSVMFLIGLSSSRCMCFASLFPLLFLYAVMNGVTVSAVSLPAFAHDVPFRSVEDFFVRVVSFYVGRFHV